MNLTPYEKKKAINHIIKNFDFKRVFQVMNSPYWDGWKPKNIHELRELAKRHLKGIQGDVVSSKSGGIKAGFTTDGEYLGLYLVFELEREDSLYT